MISLPVDRLGVDRSGGGRMFVGAVRLGRMVGSFAACFGVARSARDLVHLGGFGGSVCEIRCRRIGLGLWRLCARTGVCVVSASRLQLKRRVRLKDVS